MPRPAVHPKGDVVKVLAFYLSVLFGTGLVLGGTVLIVTQSPHHPVAIDLLAGFALTVLIYGPLFLGSVAAQWDVRKSEGSRAYFRHALWVVLGLEALAAVAIAVFAILVGTTVWLPILFVAGGAALTALALSVGPALARHESAHPRTSPAWRPVSRREIRQKILVIVVTFVGLFVGAAIVLGAFQPDTSSRHIDFGLLLTVELAAIGAAIANIIVAFPLNKQVMTLVGGDLGTVRKVAKVVLANKRIDLDDSERVAAAKYASIIPTVLGFMLGYLTLLYIGIGIQQVTNTLNGGNRAFSIGFGVVLAATLVVFIPYYAVRIRRARTYARDNASLLSSSEETERD